MVHDIHWFPQWFVDTKPLSQDLVFFPFVSKVLKGFNSKLPLVGLIVFLESDGYVAVFVRAKLKARNMHCFLLVALELVPPVSPLQWISPRESLKLFMYSFNFSSDIGKFQILFPSGSSYLDTAVNVHVCHVLRGAQFARYGRLVVSSEPLWNVKKVVRKDLVWCSSMYCFSQRSRNKWVIIDSAMNVSATETFDVLFE